MQPRLSALWSFWPPRWGARTKKTRAVGKGKNPPRMRVKCAVLCATVLSSGGCTTRLSGDFCDVYLPVRPDYERDTPETVRQVDLNNIVYLKCL